MRDRRSFIGVSAATIFGVLPIRSSVQNWSQSIPRSKSTRHLLSGEINELYPTTDPAAVRAVVGAAHTQFDRVKELVDARPELAWRVRAITITAFFEYLSFHARCVLKELPNSLELFD